MDTPKSDLFRIQFWRLAINPSLRRHGHIATLVCCLSIFSSFVGLRAEEITTSLFDPNEAERDAQRKAAWDAEKDLKIGEKKVESRAEEVRRRFDLDLEGPNHRVVEVISSTPNQKGEVVVSTNKIVQLGDGLNYWDGAKWAESQAEFDLNEGYASASKTRHKVNIGGNLNVRGAVAVRMPDNQPFRATVHGLAYYDRATGKSVLLAPIKDSQAYRINSQQILFKDAFEGVNADVRYTISLNRLEQDILLREALPPPEKFQLASATTSLEIWTEIYDAPEPSTYTERNPSGRLESTGDTDEATHIGFGSMTITPGFSFREGREILPHLRKPVRKSWAKVDDRRFLVESLELSDVAEILTELPAANPSGAFLRPVQNNRQQSLLALPRKASSTAMLPVRDAIGNDKLQVTLNPKRDGLVLDFTIDLATDTTQGFTFKGTETYHVVAQKSFGPYTNNPPSKVVFEGGTVIKFKKYNSSTNLYPGLDTNCDVDFLGTMYRPIIFTAESDNTVGAMIPNLTETTPNGYYAYTALILRAWNSTRTFNLNWIKFNRAVNPLAFGGGPAHTLRNVQFLNSYYGFATYQTTISIYNGLFSNLAGVFYSDSSTAATIRGEHLTIRNIAEWLAWNVKPTFVNSIVMGVQQYNPYLSIPLYPEWVGYGDLPSGNLINTTPETNNAAAFVTAQQGNHYLPLNSPHRNAGTATINPRLAADLQELTTEAPIQLVGPINADTTLGPRVFRDIDIPDRGYHYAPLDYYGNAIWVNSATLTLKDGIAIACDANYLFTLNSSGKIVSIGRPENLNHLTSYQTVQEGDSTIWTVAGILTLIDGGFVDLSFTDISIPASTKDNRRLFDFDFNGLISLRDCTIRGGYWFVWSTAQTNNPSLSLNNSIFEQCEFNFRQGDVNDTGYFPLTLTIRNCLFTGSIIDLKRSTHDYGNWYIIDNLFDLSSGSLSYYNVSAVGAGIELLGYNGYTTATTFLQDWSSRVNLTRDFTVGPLGNYYYPDTTSNTNSLATLVNQGFDGNSWNAATNGLYHHTVQINGTKEGTSRIDIGFHYVATDSRQASTGFSSTQGVNGWSYNYVTSLGNPSSRAALPWNTNSFWGGTADGDTYCQIYSTGMHPGSTYDSMRSFLIPTRGKVAIYGLATDAAPQTPSSTLDGVQARAMYGDEVLVPWQIVAEGASNVPVNGATRMLMGNYLHFQLNKRSANGYDSTTWNPRVLFDSPLDTDGDGIKDYLEDRNGDGGVNSGETDWNLSNTLGSGANNLTVFTPLQ